MSGIATFVPVICQAKTARLPDCYCFLGGNIHDCRDSQPSSGWLRKVGVLDLPADTADADADADADGGRSPTIPSFLPE
jgi:hypothetical protein